MSALLVRVTDDVLPWIRSAGDGSASRRPARRPSSRPLDRRAPGLRRGDRAAARPHERGARPFRSVSWRPEVADSFRPAAGTSSHSSGYTRMPAPITARTTNPMRHSRGSELVYSANPPQTPPSTLLVELRRSRRFGTPAAGAGGAGGQDGWSGRGGSSGDGTSEAEGSGNGLTVMAESL